MRAESARVQIRHTRSTALSHLPLRRLALCLDCEACFEIGTSSCPACGGDTWVLLSKFLDQGPLKVLPQFHPFPKSWTAETKGRPDAKGHDEAHSQAAKQIFVVARDREKLFEYAKRVFSGNSSVEVVLDRRRGERRGADKTSSPDRRRGDRRLMNEIDNHLRALGWAVVRLDVFRTLGLTHRSAAR
jgi:hypothetical protein